MKHRCVIVEDQTMVLQLLAGMVRNSPGVDLVGTFSRVKDATDYCGRHAVDLLILDLELPDGHGLSVLKAATAKNSRTKAIVLSGHASVFVCPGELRPQVRAVVDKTQAYGTLQKEIAEIIHPEGEPRGFTNPQELLTQREYEVFAMVGKGRMSKEIAEKLKIAVRTVETHRKAICRKLKVSGPELVRQAAVYLQTKLSV
jgi:DNA-binding NarL/FixJ family response regulator